MSGQVNGYTRYLRIETSRCHTPKPVSQSQPGNRPGNGRHERETMLREKSNKLFYAFFLLSIVSAQDTVVSAQDWANFSRYRNENAELALTPSNGNRIVFMGNSITEGWKTIHPEFFSGKPYINRGISGQTTPQMLLRFRADVINLNPELVIILAGTNDIAENTGPSTIEMIADNIISMAELSIINDIKIIICSVLPVYDYTWKTGLNPVEKINALNEIIRNYALNNEIMYLDYYSLMVDDKKGLIKDYTYDGVHPNKKGYKIMSTLAEAAIATTLSKEN